MTDSPDTPRSSNKAPGSKPQVRAAALGLLAVAALIAAVLLFGGNDDDSNSAAGESGTATSASEVSESPASTDAPSSEPSTAPSPAPESPDDGAQTPTEAPAAPPTDSTAGQSEAPAPAQVTTLITSQSWNPDTKSIEVVGAVQGEATETSTCTATAVMGSASQQASVPGTFDGQGTSCGLISIPMDGMPAGTYQVIITFDSGSGPVASEPVNVNVP